MYTKFMFIISVTFS